MPVSRPSAWLLALPLLGALAGCESGAPSATDQVSHDSTPAPACRAGTFASEPARPAVLFVLDRSQSMAQPFGDGAATRWQVLGEALASALPALDAAVATGALLFPTPGVGGGPGGSCVVASTASLAPAPGHVPALLSLVQGSSPGGSTPTADAIESAAGVLQGVHAAATARALVVATDGGPDCNGDLDPATCECVNPAHDCSQSARRCLDRERTVARIAAHAARGLPTYVIGLQDADDSSYEGVLEAMAAAGGRARVGGAHGYYAATSGAELSGALAAIGEQLACTFLTTPLSGPDSVLTVTVAGSTIRHDPDGADGWSWGDRNNGEIVLHGPACAQAQGAGAPVLTVQCHDG